MKKLLGLLGIIWGLASCTMSGSTYSSMDKNKENNFANYRTFAWLPRDSAKIQNILYDNDIFTKTIRESTNKELIQRGYSIEKYKPDILLQYTLIVEQKEEEIINTQVIQSLPAGPNVQIPPYNANAYDSPANLYFYSDPGNISNSSYYINNYPHYTAYGFPVMTQYQLNNNVQQVQYKEGTLVIDVIDRKTKELVWRGWNTEALDDPNSYQQNLPRKIHDLFKKYPSLKTKKRSQ